MILFNTIWYCCLFMFSDKICLFHSSSFGIEISSKLITYSLIRAFISFVRLWEMLKCFERNEPILLPAKRGKYFFVAYKLFAISILLLLLLIISPTILTFQVSQSFYSVEMIITAKLNAFIHYISKELQKLCFLTLTWIISFNVKM